MFGSDLHKTLLLLLLLLGIVCAQDQDQDQDELLPAGVGTHWDLLHSLVSQLKLDILVQSSTLLLLLVLDC